ncbi:ribonuclease J [Rickettsiales endosymbiont of Peranema trichophorum]|nr:ribonuclease J [Rickettsiales endosymbiont of Peranema trichophorum]RZI47611.1 ribonuclease J [Rickettsiales endosymbiont of Peranema trichophorum]
MNCNFSKDDLLFLPLGGAGEIGLNCYLYHDRGKWLIIDLGLGFADPLHFPGVSILVPNVDFLIKHKKDIAGLVLTHAHEDHIGAVPYLWQELECPIYGTSFTTAILKAKFAEAMPQKAVKIVEVQTNTQFQVGPFSIELVGLTHSIPEMQGIILETSRGKIFHTGDWKLDKDPVIGDSTNEKRLKSLGDDGVLAMVCDSTNIFADGVSGSEGELAKSLRELISSVKNGTVVVTTFASNIARIHSIALAAEASGRRVALIGRALWRCYEAAKECGYLTDLLPFVSEREIKKIRREDLLVICTGCQGEPLAAAAKLSNDHHPSLKMAPGDLIIFSSKIIPGNEKRIFQLFNKFCKLGVEVLTEQDHFVHVSGHPNRDEMARMYKLVRPKIAIPVHGEAVHLHEHSKFALAHGAKQSVEAENGTLFRITETKIETVGHIKAGKLAIDGNFILASNSNILKMRRKLMNDGAVVVTLIFDSKSKILKPPTIIAPGVLDADEDDDILSNMRDEIYNHFLGGKRYGTSEIRKYVENTVRRVIKFEVGKTPEIVSQVEWL